MLGKCRFMKAAMGPLAKRDLVAELTVAEGATSEAAGAPAGEGREPSSGSRVGERAACSSLARQT
jgi:hypothetical protein